MEEDKTSIDGILEKLALITDATQKLFPYGKTLIVFELDEEDVVLIRTMDQKKSLFFDHRDPEIIKWMAAWKLGI